jgi:hypothetical protein
MEVVFPSLLGPLIRNFPQGVSGFGREQPPSPFAMLASALSSEQRNL